MGLRGLLRPPGWGVHPATLTPGATVEIAYWGYTVLATVIEVEPMGRYGKQHGWVTVEQITDYEDEEQRPRFDAAAEYMRVPKQPTASERNE